MELWSPEEMEVHLGENQIDTIHPRRLYARETSVSQQHHQAIINEVTNHMRLQRSEAKILESLTKIEYSVVVWHNTKDVQIRPQRSIRPRVSQQVLITTRNLHQPPGKVQHLVLLPHTHILMISI